jgi:endoribonuclease Dicer
VHQPSPSLLFQSITRRSANEKTDMENLEILGDCYLKLAMSMSLYHQYPLGKVGQLTSKKDKQVSNENLYRLAMKMNLKNYLYANQVIYTGKEANWIPPGFTVNEEKAERYNKQKAKRKAFADLMEALIGALLISTDYMTTIKFMKWLGLDVIPVNEQSKNQI